MTNISITVYFFLLRYSRSIFKLQHEKEVCEEERTVRGKKHAKNADFMGEKMDDEANLNIHNGSVQMVDDNNKSSCRRGQEEVRTS